MPRLALVALLSLAACSSSSGSASSQNSDAVPIVGWRTERGRVPTQAEFTAFVASCQDRTKSPRGDLDSCLADMGLRRSR